MTNENTHAMHQQKVKRVAAFFDIDGTLLPAPSLERRFVSSLFHTGQLRLSSLVCWLVEAARLVPRGFESIRHANKIYFRGAQQLATVAAPTRSGASFSFNMAHRQDGGLKPAATFFPSALDRLAWHASNGHAIILVSGTIEFLAREVAVVLEDELRQSGHVVSIRVCATRLEEQDGRWTGRILGDPIVGPAKARAAQRIAQEAGLDLARSFAYGDSASDRWLLATVGSPAAVNPSRQLARGAALCSWPVLHWHCEESRQPCRTFLSAVGAAEVSPARKGWE